MPRQLWWIKLLLCTDCAHEVWVVRAARTGAAATSYCAACQSTGAAIAATRTACPLDSDAVQKCMAFYSFWAGRLLVKSKYNQQNSLHFKQFPISLC